MARHKAHPFAPWLLLSLAACEGWPRFAHPHEVHDPFTKFPTILQLDEDLQTDADFLPAPPAGGAVATFATPTHEPLELNQLFGAAQVLGSIQGSGGLQSADEPFPGEKCGAAVQFGVSGAYLGDVDFIRANVATGGLCLVLSPREGSAPPAPEDAWDIIVVQTDEKGSCFMSSFLTLPAENGEASQIGMPGTNFAALPDGKPLGQVLVMIALASESTEPKPYSLHLLPTRDDQRSCTDPREDRDGDGRADDLTEEDFGPYTGGR